MPFALRQFLARRLEQFLARDHFVDQPELERFLRAVKFAFENHFRRRVRPDQARQARRAAPGRHEPERRFRQTDPRRRIVGRDAIIAGQRDLVAAAGTGAVNRGDGRDFKRREPVKDLLPFGDEGAQLAGLRLSQQRLADRRRR